MLQSNTDPKVENVLGISTCSLQTKEEDEVHNNTIGAMVAPTVAVKTGAGEELPGGLRFGIGGRSDLVRPSHLTIKKNPKNTCSRFDEGVRVLKTR